MVQFVISQNTRESWEYCVNKSVSQNRTAVYSIHKGANSRYNAINNKRLTTITDVGFKPPKSSAGTPQVTSDISL